MVDNIGQTYKNTFTTRFVVQVKLGAIAIYTMATAYAFRNDGG
ncbi:hypothetical protein M7I_2516 [Glarea lozoyensis 74030]|uniref:Uncharacterized protein n=1 Tax=Glarea lozoyensis (strain ATCC 74030 / MF5533) TaxID=1104152 RepID=H0EIZ4_GLAL7|nr:hypothetical protein M7I_2516 [Glarea lozoyensis 74030]